MSPPKRGKGINFLRIIRGRKRGDVKMKLTESIKGALCQRQAENVKNRDQKN